MAGLDAMEGSIVDMRSLHDNIVDEVELIMDTTVRAGITRNPSTLHTSTPSMVVPIMTNPHHTHGSCVGYACSIPSSVYIEAICTSLHPAQSTVVAVDQYSSDYT